MKTSKLKIVFMGTPDFAAYHLAELLKCPHHFDIKAVYTNPDKPKGRSKKPVPSSVKEFASDHPLEIIQVKNFRSPESLKQLASFHPDIIVVVAYGLILTQEVLNIPSYGAINIHASLLPSYRGPSPVHFALLNGETRTGVTSFVLDKGIDTGSILLQKETDIDSHDDFSSLSQKLMHLGAKCLIETLWRIKESRFAFKGSPQLSNPAQYAGKISKDSAILDFSRPSDILANQIRALNSWPVCSVSLPVKNKITGMKIYKANPLLKCPDCKSRKTGEINIIQNKAFHIKCKKGCLNLSEVQLQGKKRMVIADFLNGHKINSGILLKSN